MSNQCSGDIGTATPHTVVTISRGPSGTHKTQPIIGAAILPRYPPPGGAAGKLNCSTIRNSFYPFQDLKFVPFSERIIYHNMYRISAKLIIYKETVGY